MLQGITFNQKNRILSIRFNIFLNSIETLILLLLKQKQQKRKN